MKGKIIIITILIGLSSALMTNLIFIEYGIENLGLEPTWRYLVTVFSFLIFATLFCFYGESLAWGSILGFFAGASYTLFSSVIRSFLGKSICLMDIWVYGLIGALVFLAVGYLRSEQDLLAAVLYILLPIIGLGLLVYYKEEAMIECPQDTIYRQYFDKILKYIRDIFIK